MATGAECAHQQDHFWKFHDLMFAGESARSALIREAELLNMDLTTFSACLDGDLPLRVTQDISSAIALKVGGTPTFLVGFLTAEGRVEARLQLSGMAPIQTFRQVFDELLAMRSKVN
jgi:protein-disulfide isomerase